MKEDDHGVQHDIRETWNQSMNKQKSVSDTWSEGGFTKELRTQGDRAQVMTYVGTAAVPMSVNGKTEMVMADVTASFSRPSPDAPWSGGVMTAHSTEHGEHRYALSDVKMDDRGLPDMSKGMTVTSSDGTKLHTRHDSDNGLIVTTTEGNAGEVMRTYSGSPADGVEVFHKDGTHERMTGVVHGQGGVAPDGSGLPFQASLTTDKNGYRGELRGEMSYNADSGRWEMRVSDEQWWSRIGGQSSGSSVWVGQTEGHGGYELVSGDIKYDGDPGKVGTPWHYQGLIRDLETGEKFNGHMHFDGRQMYMSDMSSGNQRRSIEGDGSQVVIYGDPFSPEGAQYTKTSAVSGWFPVDIGKDGTKLYELIRGRLTETGIVRGIRAEGKPSSIEYIPNDSKLTATTSQGQLDVAAFKTVVPGSQIHRRGDLRTTLKADKSDGTSEAVSSAAPKAVPVGDESPVPVFMPVDGKVGRQLTFAQTHKEPDGKYTAENLTRDPFTMAKVKSRREGGDSVSVDDIRKDHVPWHGFAVTITSDSSGKELYKSGEQGENFVARYNNRAEYLSGTTLDTMGLVRDIYERMGGHVTPGDDKFFRDLAYGLETGRLTVEYAQRLLSLRYSVQRARGGGKMAQPRGGQPERDPSGNESRDMMREGFEAMK